MRQADFREFVATLDAACALLSRGNYTPNAASAAIWFRALQGYDLRTVQAAFDAHVRDPQRGRFVPTPADLIAQIEGLAADDGRPAADEAWAIAMRSTDEADTVVWTAEIAEAFGIARPVLLAGDEVGARMAFRDAYNRLVGEARRQRQAVSWSASLGFDPTRREKALSAAVAAGLLTAENAPDVPMLPAPEKALIDVAPPHIRQRLLELADRMRNAPEHESPDAKGRRETAEKKAAAARRVAEFEQQPATEEGAE